jgi:hypothetical protein
MARFGSKSQSGGNRAKPTLLPVYRERIVARFNCEGKPDRTWKSRIFNNLAHPFRTGPACLPGISRGIRPRWPALKAPPGQPRAIVVLVE